MYFLNLCPPLHNICAYSIFPFTLQLWLPLIGICRSTLHLRKKKRRPFREEVLLPSAVSLLFASPLVKPRLNMNQNDTNPLVSSKCSSSLGNLTVALRRSSFCKPSTARCVSLGGKTFDDDLGDSASPEPQTLMECPHARQANSLLPPNLNESHCKTETEM